MSKRVCVVAAVITPSNAATRADLPLKPQTPVLLAQRPEGKHLAGCWEFPGGQIEVGEEDEQALARELKEELGITVHEASLWTVLTHHYPEKTVTLKIYRVHHWSGVPSGCEGQAIEWVPWQLVPERPVPPADQALLKVFGMAPYAMMFSPSKDHLRDDGTLQRLAQHLSWIGTTDLSGHSWWLNWRLWDDMPERIKEAKQAIEMIQSSGHVAMLSGPPDMAQFLGADGVHLDTDSARGLTARPEGFQWVSMACHDQLQLQNATILGVDFVTLSPLRQTASHPGQAGMGGHQFKALIAHAGMPVLALGGLGMSDLAWARSLGCFGIASLKGFMPTRMH